MKNKYRLSIFRTGGTARVIAFGDNDACAIPVKDSNGNTDWIRVNSFKFHHNGVTASLTPYPSNSQDLLSYEDSFLSDEDYFVEFESSTELKIFSWNLYLSEFYSPRNCNLLHNCADGANYALSKIQIVDTYLMSSPSLNADYIDSKKNTCKLYLYRDNDKIFFYQNGKRWDLPDSIFSLAKECNFDQLPDDPKKCTDKKFCEAVLEFTSKQSNTSANFKVDFKKTFSRYSPTTFCRIPFISTPYELFLASKDFKIKQLEDRCFPFKLELAKKALEFRIRTNQDKVPFTKVEEIICETDKRAKNNFHHAEFYLKLLIDTNDSIIQSLNHQENLSLEPYRQSAAFFKNRAPCKVKSAMDETIALNLFIFIGTIIISNYISYKSNQFFLKDFSLLWRVPSHIFSNIVVSKLFNAFLNKFIFPHTASDSAKKIEQEIKDCHTAVETPLSEAITDLASELEKNSGAALTCKR